MADKRDPEIPMGDPELDALMAELEAETGGATAAPADPVIEVVEGKPAAPEIPPEAKVSGKVTTEEKIEAIVADAAKPPAEPSNFVVPEKVAPIDDPLPWEDDPSTGMDAGAGGTTFSVPDFTPMTGEQMKAKLKEIAAQYGATSEQFEQAKAEAARIAQARKPALKVVPPPAAEPAPAAAVAEAEAAVAELEKEEEAKPADGSFGTPENPRPKPAPLGLRHSIDPAEFKSAIAINPTNLDDAFLEQASLRAYYGELAARAEAQADLVKVQVEVQEAMLYDKHRKLLAATGEKVTEKAVENAVKVDPRWLQLKNRLIEAETIAAINKGAVVAALNDRRDMLIQIGADRREEGKGAMRVLEKVEARERAAEAFRRSQA